MATLLVGKWTKTVDLQRVHYVLDGNDPFDYASMTDEHGAPAHAEESEVHVSAHPPAPINPADRLQPTPQVDLDNYARRDGDGR